MIKIIKIIGVVIMTIGAVTITTSWYFGQIDGHIGMHALILGWIILNSAEIKELQNFKQYKL